MVRAFSFIEKAHVIFAVNKSVKQLGWDIIRAFLAVCLIGAFAKGMDLMPLEEELKQFSSYKTIDPKVLLRTLKKLHVSDYQTSSQYMCDFVIQRNLDDIALGLLVTHDDCEHSWPFNECSLKSTCELLPKQMASLINEHYPGSPKHTNLVISSDGFGVENVLSEVKKNISYNMPTLVFILDHVNGCCVDIFAAIGCSGANLLLIRFSAGKLMFNSIDADQLVKKTNRMQILKNCKSRTSKNGVSPMSNFNLISFEPFEKFDLDLGFIANYGPFLSGAALMGFTMFLVLLEYM